MSFVIKLPTGNYLFENRVVKQNTPAGKQAVGTTSIETSRIGLAQTYPSKAAALAEGKNVMTNLQPVEVVEL